MDIIQAHATKNLCYVVSQRMTPQGIVVHSTGANNPNLKRYVDCPAEVGVNPYGNHWNTVMPGGRQRCVHAFIGYDKNKTVRVAEILPLNICCWGVGSGPKGSYNFNPPYIQFEICEDDLTDPIYFKEAFRVAVEYGAHLCRQYHLTPSQIVSHKEAHARGYGNNHGDPDHWMQRFGYSMDGFRRDVERLLENPSDTAPAEKLQTDAIHAGDLVSIASDATYYNGKPIPLWVRQQNWYVRGEPKGDRVVIDRNEKNTNAICSPVNARFLTVVRKAG